MDKQILASAGFDLGWLQAMEAKFSPTVFAVIGDYLNQGFTVAWVVASLDKLHPLMMDVLYKVFAIPALASARLGASADAVPGGLNGVVSKETMIFFVQQAIGLLPSIGLTGYKLFAADAGLKILLAFLSGTPA